MSSEKRSVSLRIATALYLLVALYPIVPALLLYLRFLFLSDAPVNPEIPWYYMLFGAFVFNLPWAILGTAGALLLYSRRALGYVLCAALTLLDVIYLVLMKSIVASATAYISPLLSVLAFYFLIRSSTKVSLGLGKNTESTQRKFWTPFKLVTGVLLVCACFTVLPYLLILSEFREGRIGNADGNAPEGTYEERVEWAEDTYGSYFAYVKKWIHASPLIQESVGVVQKIAPIDGPNYFQNCFTDGCYAAMNLEVIGDHGRGVLYAPYVNINNYHSTQYAISSFGAEAAWIHDGETYFIASDGGTLLKARGLEDFDRQFREQVASGGYETAVRSFRDAEEELKDLPRPLAAEYLMLYGDSLHGMGQNENAAQAYKDAAKKASTVMHSFFSVSGEEDESLKMRTLKGLRDALAYLRRAHKMSPDFKGLNHEASRILSDIIEIKLDMRYGRVPDGNIFSRNTWGKRSLGFFYSVARDYIYEAHKIREDLGYILYITPTKGAQNSIVLSSEGYYYSFMDLTVYGLYGSGRLRLRLNENKKIEPQIDLFAEEIRIPGRHQTLRAPEWEFDGQKYIISGKDGKIVPKFNRK